MSYPEALKKWAVKQLNEKYAAITFNPDWVWVEFSDEGDKCDTCGYEDLGVRICGWRHPQNSMPAPWVGIRKPFDQIVREILEEDSE